MKKISLVFTLVLLAVGITMAQRTVVGTVSDNNGEPLIGATVLVKGTSVGTATDFDGKYAVEVPSGSSVLVFSYTGFTEQEVTLGASNVVNIVLDADAKVLDEVVVTALGFETKRSKVGTASTTVDGGALSRSGEVALINSLSGKSPGVNITSSSGDPGASSRIQIRGATSITGNLEPLIVVDGIPIFNDSYYGQAFGGNVTFASGSTASGGGVTQQSRLNDLNPDDIEKIEVIRGASAAAVWGSRAANGVLMITTKKGKYKKGKDFTIGVTSSVAFDQLNKEIPLTKNYGPGNDMKFQFTPGGGRSWGDMLSERAGGEDDFITEGEAGYAGKFVANDGSVYYAIANGTNANQHGGKNSQELFDPYKAIFHTGSTYSNSFNISQADEKGNVYFSLSHLNQTGIVKTNSTYSRTTAMLNASRRIGKYFTIEANTNYSYNTSNRIQMGSNLNGLFLGGLRTPADFNMTDFEGTYFDAAGNGFTDRQRAYRNPLGAGTNSIYDNPIWMINRIPSDNKVNRFIGKMEVRFEPLNWLNFTLRGGADSYTDEREDLFPAISSGINNGGRFSKETLTSRQYQLDLIGRASQNLTDDIKLVLLLGVGFNEQNFDDHGSTTRAFVNPFSPPQLNNGTNITAFNFETHERQQGTYGQLSLEFFDQLFVNLTGRFDYLSTLPDKTNGVFYPGGDLAWQFSKLIPSNDVLSSGRLRLGYGRVGRGPAPYSTATPYFVPSAANVGWGEGWNPGVDPNAYGGAFAQSTAAGNPNLKPEIKTEIEGGLDLGFWKNRITLNATYYTNTTDDLILQVATPESSGFTTQLSNAAKIENKGIELEARVSLISNRNFDWNIYGNFSRNRNKVLEMAGTNQVAVSGFNDPQSSAVIGEQLGVLFGTRWDRDDDGNIIFDEFGFPTQANDLGIVGDPNPDYKYGVGSGLSWKNFNMNILFDVNQGAEIWNGTRAALAFFGKAAETDVTTTLTEQQATTLKIATGQTVAERYAFRKAADGSYTVRGEIKDFGAGDVFVEETWYRIGLGSGFTGPSEPYIEDASWARLRELTLSYTFTKDLLKLSWLENATLSFTGRNLALWTDYTGNDPDTNLVGPGNNGQGLDYFINPSTKSYKVGLNLTF